MKKVLSLVALAMISTIMFAVNDGAKTNQNKKEAKSGEVIVMNKEMFINDVFDYQNSKEWKYKVINLLSSTYMPIGVVLAA